MNNNRKYWHKVSDKRKKQIIGSNIPYGKFIAGHKQPKWCLYEDALEGVMGCWSLVMGDIRGKKDCDGCDMCKGCQQ